METHRIDIGPDKGHVIVALIDGRLHVDVDCYPNDFPMTIAVGDVIKYDREDAPEPPKKAWERHYGMFSDEGQRSCEFWVQRATETAWPLATTRQAIVEWIQKNVSDEGKASINAEAATYGEVYDTVVREAIHDAIDAFIDGRNQ